jgi:putative ABC transport system substrate-binding protein
MRRRQFIGGLAAFLPFMRCSAQAQASTKPALIAILSTGSEADVRWETLRRSLQRGLRELGYAEGRHYLLEERFAAGMHSRLPMLADELVRLKPDIIIASSGPAALAAQNITAHIPILSPALGEALGFASQARPGRNITGILVASSDMAAKQLALTRELVPGATKIGLLINPRSPGAAMQHKGATTAAAALSVELAAVEARTADDFGEAFATMARAGVGAACVAADTFFFFERRRIAAAAQSAQVPTVYNFREYVEAGGLMSYGVDLQENYRQIARYADKILKGARPADLPVELPTKFELVINLKTATALGVTIPPSLLARADEVIE